MLEALDATLKAQAVESALESIRNLALGLALQARATMARRVRIRARCTPVRYKGLRSRRASMLMRSAFAFQAAKIFGDVAMVAHSAEKGVG